MLKTIYLFIALVIIGLIQSYRTPFCVDETFSKTNMQGNSYLQIIQGKMGEGCNNPLFYLIQKLDGDSRLFPILCMALAISIVFYVLLTHFNIKYAVLGVVLFLLPRITWQHFPECRPYSLIVLLTTLQWTVVRIESVAIINILMAFTDMICIIPIIMSALMAGKKYWWIAILPTIIIAYYFSVSVYKGNPYNLHTVAGLSNRYFIYLLPIGVLRLVDWVIK